jgi:hypothetical protein
MRASGRMKSFVKLFGSILDSSIWGEPSHVKLVWITMLAMADKYGEVDASVPGLAKRAGVTRNECDDALQRFLSPDPDSRNPENEGRRIEVIQGGWGLLNHEYYRNLMSKEDQTEQSKIRMQKSRAKKKAQSPNPIQPSPWKDGDPKVEF